VCKSGAVDSVLTGAKYIVDEFNWGSNSGKSSVR
jgi:hypothetical protein